MVNTPGRCEPMQLHRFWRGRRQARRLTACTRGKFAVPTDSYGHPVSPKFHPLPTNFRESGRPPSHPRDTSWHPPRSLAHLIAVSPVLLGSVWGQRKSAVGESKKLGGIKGVEENERSSRALCRPLNRSLKGVLDLFSTFYCNLPEYGTRRFRSFNWELLIC